MEQHSQRAPDVQSTSEEAKASKESCSSASSTPSVAPARPKRPQRSPHVEGSTDISDPEITELHEEKVSQTSGPAQQLTCRPFALAGNAAAVRSHISMRAASLPQAPSDQLPLTDHTVHPQRALSVAGTADTKPHSDEDFR